jgi:hypothetical protein
VIPGSTILNRGDFEQETNKITDTNNKVFLMLTGNFLKFPKFIKKEAVSTRDSLFNIALNKLNLICSGPGRR